MPVAVFYETKVLEPLNSRSANMGSLGSVCVNLTVVINGYKINS